MWGAIAGAVLGYLGQKQANDANVEQAGINRDFQANMSGTAYQRAVGDMQAAGLNPMLAYSQGGASTPIGGMPQVQNALGAGVASGQQTAQTWQAIQQAKATAAQVENIKAQTDKTRSETMEHKLNTALLVANTRNAEMGSFDKEEHAIVNRNIHRLSAGELGAQGLSDARPGIGHSAVIQRLREEARQARLKADIDEPLAQFARSPAGDINPFLKQVLGLVNDVSSAVQGNRNSQRPIVVPKGASIYRPKK